MWKPPSKLRARRIFIFLAVAVGVGFLPSLAGAQRFSDWSAATNLGPTVNTASTDGCPFISKSGLSLYFASNRVGGQGLMDIWVTQRVDLDEPWGAPQNLGSTINSNGAELCPTVTIDAHWFYFVSDRAGGCGGQDIYRSRRRNKRDDFGWEPPENLGCELNSPFNDITPAFFEDEDTGKTVLYFSSNRPGGPGGTDIYVSEMGEDGTFGPAVLVEELNTIFLDQRPNISRDGLALYFDSNRPGSLGSTDMWVAQRGSTSEPWAEPVHLGGVVNTASTEGRPSISFDGTALYFMSNRPGGSGGIDVYVTTRTKLRGPQ